MENKSYTLFLNSSDKIVGNNNNAQFNVIWDSFLPREYQNYEVSFSLQTTSGVYTNINMCTVAVDFKGSSFSYDSTINSVSNILGYVFKDQFGSFNIVPNAKLIKCITRPTQSIINIKIYSNNTTNLLLDTPVISTFKGSMATTTLTVDSTTSPLNIIETNSVITGYGVAANTTIVMRASAYTYTINNSVNTANQPMLMTSGTVPTDMTPWTMIIKFTPVK